MKWFLILFIVMQNPAQQATVALAHKSFPTVVACDRAKINIIRDANVNLPQAKVAAFCVSEADLKKS